MKLLRATSLWVSLVVCSCCLFLSCKDAPLLPDATPKITTGASVEVASQSIPATGGTVVVRHPGSSIDGMEIKVPNRGYVDTRRFVVTSKEITKHSFGDEIHILTPLIEISNGGGYSDEPMSIRVPVRIPKGQFALAFQYNEATQSLEALPLIYEDSTEVRFITRHFSFSKTSAPEGVRTASSSFRSSILGESEIRSSIFISSIDAATLDATYETGFEMGEDNFPFVNWGSAIARDGHCGGQSIAMMWYYSMKKRNGSPSLFSAFDNDGIDRTPEIWFDDVHAFRFCSVLQNAMHWTNLDIYTSIDKSWDRDLVTYRSIAFAIRETGNPQCLYVSDGTVAHAIIAYRTSNGRITVCDPNFPVQEKSREILFVKSSGDFNPYYSGSNASNTGTAYFNIYLAANSALIDYDIVKKQYDKVLDGTIGADQYPAVRVKVRNTNNEYVDLRDGLSIPSQQTIDVSADGFTPEYIVWDYDSRTVIVQNERNFVLKKGEQKIGVYYSDTVGTNPLSGYIGFTWFTVNVVDDGPVSEPDYGPIRLNLRANGVAKTIISSMFEYNLYRTIRATGANGSELFLSPGDMEWRVGTFILPASSTNVWKEGSSTYFASKPGTLSITSWSKSRAEGTFSFEATGTGGTVLVEGDFHYPP